MLEKDVQITNLRAALMLMLDAVDYTAGACVPNEMVGAVLPKEIIERARKTLSETRISALNEDVIKCEETLNEIITMLGEKGAGSTMDRDLARAYFIEAFRYMRSIIGPPTQLSSK